MERAHHHQVYVGSADASKPSENHLKKDRYANPEQQRIVEGLEKHGKLLAENLEAARLDAAEKLIPLRETQLIKAGLKQVALGVVMKPVIEGTTIGIADTNARLPAMKKHVHWLNPDAPVIIGNSPLTASEGDANDRMSELIHEYGSKLRFVKESVTVDTQKSRDRGKLVGHELTSIVYGEIARRKDLPSLKLVDWIGGHIGLLPINIMIGGVIPMNVNFINSVSFSGLRNIATGLSQIGHRLKEEAYENSLPKLPQQEISVTPIQKEVIQKVSEKGKELSKNVATERKKAGESLIKLHGKELAVAGLKQIGWGVGIGKAMEMAGVAVGKAYGSTGNRLAHFDVLLNIPDINYADLMDLSQSERELKAAELSLQQGYKNITDFLEFGEKGALMGKKIGRIAGIELSSTVYKKLAEGRNMPSVTWVDQTIGQLGILPLRASIRGVRLNVNPINPITVSGLRHTVQGLWEMGEDAVLTHRYGALPNNEHLKSID